MSWNTLQAQAKKLGFEVAIRARYEEGGGFMPDLSPPKGCDWELVGSYDNVASFWVKPLTNSARRRNGRRIRQLIAKCDPFIGTVDDDEVDFFDANAPFPADQQDMERMADRRTDSLRSDTIRKSVNFSVNL